ncbi:MAG: hypothetical protein SOW18_01190 [Peptoniphilus sp.]|nr:hypothetical protein [Peptoniphilus sp.]MDY3118135.1 hypothetical protein [Peptoniphilus sp.]
MNKNYMVNEIKNEMKSCIDGIAVETVFERRSRMEKLFDLMELLLEIETESNYRGDSSAQADEDEYYVGRVHLRLGGGTLGDENVFIPEKVLRLQNIGEGDEVRAKVIKQVYNNNHLKNIYNYELLEKSDEAVESERRVISYARVLYDPTFRGLYIEGEGEDGVMRVNLEDVSMGNLNVGEGDIVDYAYWQRDPEGGRVIWIHNMDGDNVLTSTYGNDAAPVLDDDDFLEQLQLAVFGKGSVVTEHVKALKNGGSDVVHVEEISRENIESNLNGADLVLVYLNSVRPADVKRIRDGVRKRDLDVLFIQDEDFGNILAAIRDKLENSYYFDI